MASPLTLSHAPIWSRTVRAWSESGAVGSGADIQQQVAVLGDGIERAVG